MGSWSTVGGSQTPKPHFCWESFVTQQVVKPVYLKIATPHIEDMDGYAGELFFHRMSHFDPTATLLDEKM
jgi:hypothetical protein